VSRYIRHVYIVYYFNNNFLLYNNTQLLRTNLQPSHLQQIASCSLRIYPLNSAAFSIGQSDVFVSILQNYKRCESIINGVKLKEQKCCENLLKVQWSGAKCSDVRWNGAVGNLNGVKPNERVVKCSWVKFKWEEVKCTEVVWSVVTWGEMER